MDLFKQKSRSLPPDSPSEIENRLRRRYLDRLGQRVKKIRRLLVERKWEDLRAECTQLATTGENFGFEKITYLSIAVQESIPEGRVSRASAPPRAKECSEALIAAIDSILIEHSVSRA